jgi:peptidoglycan/xylan/chitin deacetylase (PgdA/CDA1 family)
LNIYFTVDTESSMGGAWERPDRLPVPAERRVFCRSNGAEYGIPLIVEIMARYGFRATYFVETLATLCLGSEDTSSVFEFLLGRGQDVQLHVHPVYKFYSDQRNSRRGPPPCDLIGQLTSEVQRELLAEATDLFEKFAGFRPTAFRAGNWAGSRSLLRVLKELGIRVDSSFNPAYHPEISFPDCSLARNAVTKVEGVWEVPVTVAQTPLPEGCHGVKFADCTALAVPELRKMLDDAAAAGQQHFVLVFHSFSAVKARDISYRQIRPNRIVIRRLERTMRYLAENSDRFQVRTMGEIAADERKLEREAAAVFVPDLNLVQCGVRKAVQAINNFYWI